MPDPYPPAPDTRPRLVGVRYGLTCCLSAAALCCAAPAATAQPLGQPPPRGFTVDVDVNITINADVDAEIDADVELTPADPAGSSESPETVEPGSDESGAAGAEATEPAWVDLFDGRSLTGWTPVPAALWSVEDGEIHAAGPPDDGDLSDGDLSELHWTGLPADDAADDAGANEDPAADDGDTDDGDAEDGDTEDGDAEDGDAEDGDAEDGDAEDGDADEDASPDDSTSPNASVPPRSAAPPGDFEVEFEFAATRGAVVKVRVGEKGAEGSRNGFLYAEFHDPTVRFDLWGGVWTFEPTRERRYVRLNPAAARNAALLDAAAAAEVREGTTWHRVRLRVVGRTASLTVNGVDLGGGRFDLTNWTPSLALLVDDHPQANGPARATFRSVRLRPVSDEGPVASDRTNPAPSAEPTAPEVGWADLFDGGSLEGWTASPADSWSVENGELVAATTGGPGSAGLAWTGPETPGTPAASEHFEVEFEYAATPGAIVNLQIGEAAEGDGYLYAAFPAPSVNLDWWGIVSTWHRDRESKYRRFNRDRPAAAVRRAATAALWRDGEKWHRVRLRFVDGAASLTVNGVPLGGGADPDLTTWSRDLRLTVDENPRTDGPARARVRSVRVRPLDANGEPIAAPAAPPATP